MSSKATAALMGVLALALYSGLSMAAPDPYQLNLQRAAVDHCAADV